MSVTGGPIYLNGTLVGPGQYTSELSASSQTAGFLLSSLSGLLPSTGNLESIPATMPITPLTALVDAFAQRPPFPTFHLPEASLSSPASTMASYGFTTGPSIWTVPAFGLAAQQSASIAASIESALQNQAQALSSTSRGALVAELDAEIAAGGFGTGALPIDAPPNLSPPPSAAGTSLFSPGLPTFQAGSPSIVPQLPVASSPITQTLPTQPVLPPTPVPSATITRIGPAAFTETITDPAPAVAAAPFSTAGTVYTIEVVTGT